MLYTPLLPLVFPTHHLMLQLLSDGYSGSTPHLKIWLRISVLVVLVLITQVFHLNVFKILGNLLNCVSGILSKQRYA